MDRQSPLYKDIFGNSYQIISTLEPPHQAAKQKDFFCPELTETFLRSLKVPQNFWRRYANDIGDKNLSSRDDDSMALKSVAQRLVRGTLAIYEIPTSGKHALRNGKGVVFSFARGPAPLPTDKAHLSFSNEAEIDEHLNGLKATPHHWHNLLQENGLLPPSVNPQTTSEGEYRTVVKQHLLSRELLLYKSQDIPPAPKAGDSGQTESSANTPGNRMAHLESPPKGPEEKIEAEKEPTQGTYATQDEAARAVSSSINQQSIQEDTEYGGMIYRTQDGRYGYTGPIKGTIDGVDPGGPDAVPEGTTAIAFWHTHGGPNPDYDSENFSNVVDPITNERNGDIPYADYYGIDGYVATPGGKFKSYSHQTRQVTDLGAL